MATPRNRPPPLDFGAQLDTVPLRNLRVRAAQQEPGRRLVLETEVRYGRALRLLARPLRLRTRRRYELEGVGLALFEAVDGRRTVGELVDAFAAEHLLSFFEARALVVQYLAALAARGLVVFGATGGGTGGRRGKMEG